MRTQRTAHERLRGGVELRLEKLEKLARDFIETFRKFRRALFENLACGRVGDNLDGFADGGFRAFDVLGVRARKFAGLAQNLPKQKCYFFFLFC